MKQVVCTFNINATVATQRYCCIQVLQDIATKAGSWSRPPWRQHLIVESMGPNWRDIIVSALSFSWLSSCHHWKKTMREQLWMWTKWYHHKKKLNNKENKNYTSGWQQHLFGPRVTGRSGSTTIMVVQKDVCDKIKWWVYLTRHGNSDQGVSGSMCNQCIEAR